MNLNLLLMLPPLALFVMRGGWMETLIVLGALAFISYRDWMAYKADWNGSVSVDIDNANHAIKVLIQDVDRLKQRAQALEGTAPEIADTIVLVTKNLEAMDKRAKALEDLVDGHSRALQQGAKPKSIL